MKTYREVKETKKLVSSYICDVCKKASDDPMETQEWFYFEQVGGYNSIFGDGTIIQIDICQECFKERLGQFAIYSEIE